MDAKYIHRQNRLSIMAEGNSVFSQPKATDEARKESRVKSGFKRFVRACKACCGLKSS